MIIRNKNIDISDCPPEKLLCLLGKYNKELDSYIIRYEGVHYIEVLLSLCYDTDEEDYIYFEIYDGFTHLLHRYSSNPLIITEVLHLVEQLSKAKFFSEFYNIKNKIYKLTS